MQVPLNSFFPKTAKIKNKCLHLCFPTEYNIKLFKSNINKYLIDPKTPEFFPVHPYIYIPIFTQSQILGHSLYSSHYYIIVFLYLVAGNLMVNV